MMNRTILRAFATISVLGAIFLAVPAGFVAAEEAKIAALTADSQIATLLTKIEIGLKDNQGASSAGLLAMLVSAKTLLPNASTEGARLMRDFPGRLMKAADQERTTGDLVKSINLKVFADAAVPYVNDKAVDGHKAAQEQIAMIEVKPPPPAAPTPTLPAPVVAPKPPTATVAPAPAAPPPTATPVAPAPPSPMTQTLLQRGDAMLSLGDIVSARLLYQHAADAGIGIAAFKLGNTYDSDFLVQHNVRGMKADWQQAAIWYRKAQALGEPQAAQRLQAMLANVPR